MDNPMSFNTWTILFLALAIAMLLFNVFLINEFRKNKNIWYIALLVTLFSMTLIDWVMIWTKYQYVFPWFMYISFIANWAYGPLVYLYLSTVWDNKTTPYYIKLHLIPFLSLLILYLPVLLQGLVARQHIVLKGFDTNSFYAVITPGVVLGSYIHLTVYAVLIYKISRAFSSWKNSDVWAKLFCYSFILLVLNFVLFGLLKSMDILHMHWDYSMAFIMFSMVVLIMMASLYRPAFFNGYNLYEAVTSVSMDVKGPEDNSNNLIEPMSVQEVDPWSQPQAVPALKTETTTLSKYKNSGLTPIATFELAQRLDHLMQTEKLYRDYNLRLDTLAGKMKLTRHHTSQLINDHFKMNFFEYINSLRVEEAKNLLMDARKADLTIKEIGYQTGFNNKVSFFKAFKLITGKTPNEFRMQTLSDKTETL